MPQTSNSIDVKLLVGRYIRSTCPSTLETYLRETGLTEEYAEIPTTQIAVADYHHPAVTSTPTFPISVRY